MEMCSLEDAFQTMTNPPSTGCGDNRASVEARKQERKKARRCRGPAKTYIESEFSMVGQSSGTIPDPDRPSLKRMEEVPSLNKKTGLKEHEPVDQDWGTKEPFVGESCDLDVILQNARRSAKGSTAPSYFGASPSDDVGSPLPTTTKKKTKEGFSSVAAPYTDIIGIDDNFTMESKALQDSVAWQQMKQRQKSEFPEEAYSLLSPELGEYAPIELPPPERTLQWRNSCLPGGQSQFFDKLASVTAPAPPGPAFALSPSPSPGGAPGTSISPEQAQELLKKMDVILAKLDDKNHVNPDVAQREVLLFIMTGIGVLFLMDVTCRSATKLF